MTLASFVETCAKIEIKRNETKLFRKSEKFLLYLKKVSRVCKDGRILIKVISLEVFMLVTIKLEYDTRPFYCGGQHTNRGRCKYILIPSAFLIGHLRQSNELSPASSQRPRGTPPLKSRDHIFSQPPSTNTR